MAPAAIVAARLMGENDDERQILTAWNVHQAKNATISAIPKIPASRTSCR